MKDYLKYTIEEIVEDDYFINWVLKPNVESNRFWFNYILNYPEKADEIDQARELVCALYINEEHVSKDVKGDAWNFIVQSSGNSKSRFEFWKYAAVTILIVSLGVFATYLIQFENSPKFSDLIPNTLDKPVLLMDNGKMLKLDSESNITYKSDRLIVDKDTIRVKTSNIVNEEVEYNQLVIPYGNKSFVDLSDGTKVWLSAGSQLVYPSNFNKKDRTVKLLGEAYFEVKKDTKRPFYVELGDKRIKVLGTSFNVAAYADENTIETVLIEGKVKLETKVAGLFYSDVTELLPKQRLLITKGETDFVKEYVDPELYILWKDGSFKFKSEPLNNVAKKLERYFNIAVNFESKRLENLKITGKLEIQGTIEDCFNILELTAPITYENLNGAIMIRTR